MTQQHFTRLIRYTLLPLMATAALWSADPVPFADDFCQNTSLNIPQTECDALHDLYRDTNGSDWWEQGDWGVDTNVSKWKGITLTDERYNGKKSVRKLVFHFNNLNGILPNSLENLRHLYRLVIRDNFLYGEIPVTLSHIDSLKFFNLANNNYSGALSCDFLPPYIKDIDLSRDHYIGSIPSCFNNFTDLTTLYLHGNNLSGPLPDLSNLTTLHLEHNQFTFADFEPQMGWLNSVSDALYVQQRGHYDGIDYYYGVEYEDPRNVCQDYYVDERNHTVYFDHTLRIEPRAVPKNTYSNNDYFDWYKENDTDEGQLLGNGGKRIYTKENATSEDEGYYYYEANNSVVTHHPYYSDLHYCSTPRQYGIHAIHDAAPHWGNDTLPETTATVDKPYSYSSTFSDTDAADTLSVSLTGDPDWLSLSTDGDALTLSGTPLPEAAGQEYNLTLTLTDGKLPQKRSWTLHVNPKLPDGITQDEDGDTYTHTATGAAVTMTAPGPQVAVADGTVTFTYPCQNNRTPYAELTAGDGTLTSGYRTCDTPPTNTPTLTDPYPQGTILTLSPEMIQAQINLTETITMGE